MKKLIITLMLATTIQANEKFINCELKERTQNLEREYKSFRDDCDKFEKEEKHKIKDEFVRKYYYNEYVLEYGTLIESYLKNIEETCEYKTSFKEYNCYDIRDFIKNPDFRDRINKERDDLSDLEKVIESNIFSSNFDKDKILNYLERIEETKPVGKDKNLVNDKDFNTKQLVILIFSFLIVGITMTFGELNK